MEKDVKLITSGIVLIILGLVFRPLFVQLGQVRPFILSIMWFPWALVAIGGFAFVLGILKLFGVAGFRTQGQHVVGNLTYKLSTINSFEFIRFISIFYCAVAIPALSIVYLMNYGKYNQTILLLCILGLNIFLISQIIFLFFRKRYNKYNKNSHKISAFFKRNSLLLWLISGLVYMIAFPFIYVYYHAYIPTDLLIVLGYTVTVVAFFVSFIATILLASYLLRHFRIIYYPKGRRFE